MIEWQNFLVGLILLISFLGIDRVSCGVLVPRLTYFVAIPTRTQVLFYSVTLLPLTLFCICIYKQMNAELGIHDIFIVCLTPPTVWACGSLAIVFIERIDMEKRIEGISNRIEAALTNSETNSEEIYRQMSHLLPTFDARLNFLIDTTRALTLWYITFLSILMFGSLLGWMVGSFLEKLRIALSH